MYRWELDDPARAATRQLRRSSVRAALSAVLFLARLVPVSAIITPASTRAATAQPYRNPMSWSPVLGGFLIALSGWLAAI